MVRVIINIGNIILLIILMIITIKIFLKNLTFQFPSYNVSKGYIWMCYS